MQPTTTQTLPTPPSNPPLTSEETELAAIAKRNQGGNALSTWNVSADVLHTNLAHCTPEYKESLIWAFQFCRENEITLTDFADAVKYDKSVIWRLLHKKYVDPRSGDIYDIPEKLHASISKWRKHQVKILGFDANFVATPTAKRIFTACDLARESQSPVFLYGASHIGKTTALQYYKDNNNHGRTIFVRIAPNCNNLGILRDIAHALGISTNSGTVDLSTRIKRALSPEMLVIFDEVHQLLYSYRNHAFLAILEQLRAIHDHTKCGMIFCTTNVFRDRLERERKSALEQLFRRGVHRVQLGDIVPAKDVSAIIRHHELEMPKRSDAITINRITEHPYEILRQLAKEDGLKAITERLRYAKKIADSKSENLSWDQFVHAHLIIKKNASVPESDWE